MVNDFAQLEQLGAGAPVGARYVLVSHDNDGVTKFGPDLLVTAPAWLTVSDRPPAEQIARRQPARDPGRRCAGGRSRRSSSP